MGIRKKEKIVKTKTQTTTEKKEKKKDLKKNEVSFSSKQGIAVLLLLIGIALIVQIGSVVYYGNVVELGGTKQLIPADVTKHTLRKIMKSRSLGNEKRENHQENVSQNNKIVNKNPFLGPVIPYLPAHTPIPNGKELMNDVMDGYPTVAGIAHLMQTFLIELHHKFTELADSKMNNNDFDENGLHFQDIVINAYIDLTEKYLLSFDKKYRGKPIFPIRSDESVFISIAAYREHLLAQTLKGAFEKAKNPEKLFVGAVVQNCFGIGYTCKTGVEVVGKNAAGRPITKVSDRPPDVNGIEEFCGPESDYKKYCDSGQIRILYVNETEALGPAAARYYGSKLWGGENYFMQIDAHLQFAQDWDAKYIEDMKLARSYPNVVLSAYPPGFNDHVGSTAGEKLCTCEFSPHDIEHRIIRINSGGRQKPNAVRPTQIPFIAAGFFFTHSSFLVDVPFDPMLPWCFMGEEIALSMRAWTSGYDIYAPRMNNIAHQYRPGRMGLPKFWETVGRTFHRPGPGFNTKLQNNMIERIKNFVGYDESTLEIIERDIKVDVLKDNDFYGYGTKRTKEEYLKLTNIDVHNKKCGYIDWCMQNTLE